MQLQQHPQQQHEQQPPRCLHIAPAGAHSAEGTHNREESTDRHRSRRSHVTGITPPPPPVYFHAALSTCRLLHLHYTRLCLKPARLVGPGRDPYRDRRLASWLTPPAAAVQLLPQHRPGQAAAGRGVSNGTRTATGSGSAQCAAVQCFRTQGVTGVHQLEAACMAALSSHGLGAVRACDGAGGHATRCGYAETRV